MADARVVTIKQWGEVQLEGPAKTARLMATDSDGKPVELVIPHDRILSLIDLATLAYSKGEKKLARPNAKTKVGFDVTWWELSATKEGEHFLMTMTFGAGGTLTFGLKRAMTQLVLETLQVHLGGAAPTPPSTPHH